MNITQAVEFTFKDKLSKGLDNLQSQLGNVDNSIDKTQAKLSKGFNMPNSKGNGLGNIFDKGITKARHFQMANIEAVGAIVDLVPGASGAMSQLAPILTNPYIAGAAAIAGVGIAAKKAYDDYSIFNKEMAKLNVTAQLSQTELSKLEDELINIGAKSSVPLNDVPQALNKIVSAGMELPDAMNALQPTLLAAKAGFTDIETTASAAVSVMNSAGIKDATKVYDVLFATLNKGNAEFADIAQYLPKIIPGALQSGFALEETAGAFAFLTAQGQTAERSTTLLENAFRSLSNPQRIKDFNNLGVSIFDSAGQMRPLTQIAEQLSGKLDGLTDAERINKLNSLGLDMEASAAFAALAGDTDKLKDIIDFTANSSGELSNAVKNSANNTDVWLQIQNRLSAAWLRFGKAVTPLFNSIGEGVLQVIDWFGSITAQGTILNDTIHLLGWGFNLLGSSFSRIAKLAGIAFQGITFSFQKLYSFIRPLITRIANAIGGLGQMIQGALNLDTKAIEKGGDLFKKAFSKNNNSTYVAPQRLADTIDVPPSSNAINPTAPVSLEGDKAYFPTPTKSKDDAPHRLRQPTNSNAAQNIKIVIEKMVGIENLSTVNMRQTATELERFIEEVMLKSIRDVEDIT